MKNHKIINVLFLFGLGAHLLVARPAFAYWKVLSCQDNSMVVDRLDCRQGGCNYQIVIRHREALNYLVNKWAISVDEINYKQEFIMRSGYSGYDGKAVFYGETNWSDQGRNEIVVTYQKDQAWLDVYFIHGHGHPSVKDRIAHWYFPYCKLTL